MHKAVQKAAAIEVMPIDLVEFNSAGRILIVGTAQQLEAVIPHLMTLNIICCCTDNVDVSQIESVELTQQKITAIEGWLGQFTVDLESQQLKVDLILDLSASPLMSQKVLPLGYFAPRDNAQILAEALQQLPDLIGTFDKPRYFNYTPSICAHSRRGLSGCQQCIDACPAEAIISSGDSVTVNPSLCQGCGSCTTVCPSGAMTYALPGLDVSLNRLRKMMQCWYELETSPPKILVHDATNGQMLIDTRGDNLPKNVITFSIEEIGALGMTFWLSALAYGADSVTVWDAGTHDDHDWHELQHEIVKTNQMLTGLGYGKNGVSWFAGNDYTQLVDHLSMVTNVMAVEPAQFAGIDDKRRVITMALGHLHQHAPKPVASLSLGTGSAFGEIKVNKEACTLCHSCVSVCPVGAVLDGVDKPQLNFVEDLCVQCGLCEQACPENAIELIPQYVFDREQARKVKLLHEEPIFHCISCQKAFATQKMINTMIEKLKGHAMFQGEALERLKMCEDCRVKAIFNDAKGPM
ncbi:MAG: 4Fe-4S binding protein [Gammaproteobacteria bacterium]|nr:4Fe-4S binding protein [Gammaproteobacteria bacterium]MDH5592691.1 4Fe-4S binding protein [Gammaproteobacteria bacterium]